MSSFGQKADIQIDDIWGFSLLHIYRLGFGYGHILTSVSAFTDEADIENFSKSDVPGCSDGPIPDASEGPERPTVDPDPSYLT